MRILISDTSCLIDLRKGLLLEAFVRLPYDLVIPDVLFEEELINFSAAEKDLLAQSLKIQSLSGENIIEVQRVNRDYPALGVNDCFAFIIGKITPNCILLTGDSKLRNLASSCGIKVHGTLWGIDEMYKSKCATARQLYSALLSFQRDVTVRLPMSELRLRIKQYKALLDS